VDRSKPAAERLISEVITCVRCGAELTVLRECGLAFAIAYDFAQWSAVCLCRDRMGPVMCCSFLELGGLPAATVLQ